MDPDDLRHRARCERARLTAIAVIGTSLSRVHTNGTYPTAHQLRDMGGSCLIQNAHPRDNAKSSGFSYCCFVSSKALSRTSACKGSTFTMTNCPCIDPEGNRIFPGRRAAVTTDRAMDWLRHRAGKSFLFGSLYDPQNPTIQPSPTRPTTRMTSIRAKSPIQMSKSVACSISWNSPNCGERNAGVWSSAIW